MHQPERLRVNESITSSVELLSESQTGITKSGVEELYGQRSRCLEEIRPSICLKLYYTISEKLEQEKRLFEKLLHWADTTQETLAQYSFVLNPGYFEQCFLNDA